MDIVPLILKIVLDATVHFFMMADIIIFLRCFYDPNFQWTAKKSVILLVYSLAYATITHTLSTDLLVYSGWLAGILLYAIVLYDYRGKRLRGFLRFIWVYYVIGISAALVSEIGSVYLFTDYTLLTLEMTNVQHLVTSVLQVVFFGLLFFYMYYQIYKKGLFLHFQKREKFFAITYSLLCITLATLVEIYGKDGRIILSILGTTFILTAILIPIFFYYLQISKHYQDLTRHQEAHIQAELAHFLQYKQTQEETRRFRHDIRNNLLCMNEMLKEGKTEETTAYLNDLLQTSSTLRAKYISGDEMLDCIVGMKAGIMEQKQIAFQLDGVLAGGLNWKPVDICNVFANALDNAIEACELLPQEERSITMSIKSTPQFWLIAIENPVQKAVDIDRLFQKKGGFTSKADRTQHGIGTYNMKRTVETYGGMVKAECIDRTFRLEIILDKNDSI